MSGIVQSMPSPPAGPPGPPVSRLVLVYAGFWWRALAWAIDAAILGVADKFIVAATGLHHLSVYYGVSPDHLDGGGAISNVAYRLETVSGPQWHVHTGWAGAVSLLVTIAYFALLESSAWQATLGKRICRLRVTDLAGRRIGLPRAIGRYLGKFVSAFLLMIGFMMAGWTIRKQALHDLMAGTLVTRLRVSDPVFTFQQPIA